MHRRADGNDKLVNVRAVAIAVLAKPDRLARPPRPPLPSRRRPLNRSGQKEFGKKKSAAARSKARAGSAAALAREEIAQRWPTRRAGTLFPNCPRLRLRPPYLTVWVVSAPRARESG
jgi:hypothetical protein